MKLDRTQLTPSILALMSAGDREKYANAPAAVPAPAAPAPALKVRPALAGEELALHTLIRQELNRRQIPFVHADPRKKSPLPPGWPDFTVFAHAGVRLVEVKTEVGKLDPDQITCHTELATQGYVVAVARSFDEFLAACGLSLR